MTRRRVLTMPFEVERGRETVEYLVEYEVSPAEPMRGPSRDSPGEPGCAAEVERKSVFYVRRVGTGRVREERPELEDLVSDEELLEHAGECEDYGDDDESDRRRDERRIG